MANHAQAKKRIRQIGRRTVTNSVRRTRIRSFVRKVEEAIESLKSKNLIYELMQNEEREVLGYRPLIFKIGNPEATKIFINNKIINISRISKKDANYSFFEIK